MYHVTASSSYELPRPPVGRSDYRVAEPGVPITLAFGRAVRRLRARAGYSEEQLGARAGLSPVQVAAIERGARDAPLAVMERLAAAFGIRVSELLAEAEAERRRAT